MTSLWKQWREEAQADYDRFKPDLDKVEELLKHTPDDARLLRRKEQITWYLNGILEGIEMMKEFEERNP